MEAFYHRRSAYQCIICPFLLQFLYDFLGNITNLTFYDGMLVITKRKY